MKKEIGALKARLDKANDKTAAARLIGEVKNRLCLNDCCNL